MATLVAASLLGGCGFMHRHFDRKNDDYKRAVESRPLEVPPDLDTPSSNGALSVPAASTRTAVAATATNPSLRSTWRCRRIWLFAPLRLPLPRDDGHSSQRVAAPPHRQG